MSVTIGSKLGPYEVLSTIGAGGMGEVFRARDSRLGRDVALKILPDSLLHDAARRGRFEQEARAVAALNHPNIVAVYDVGENYMVSELVDGESLRDLIAQGPVPFRRLIDIGAEMADGLAAAHSAGIVHRDMKPENVMLTRDGRVKILDFGLARQLVPPAAAVEGATRTIVSGATQPGTILGTVAYMSPEQVRGQTADHRSDIFSLGIILHEMITGSQPFRGESSVETMSAVLKEDAPDLPPPVSPSLRLIVGRCLEKNPARRFQSATDLAFALRSTSSGSGVTTVLPAIRRRLRIIVPALLALAGACLGAAGAWWWSRAQSRDASSVVRLILNVPVADQVVPGAVGLSPDAKRVVYVARRSGQTQLFVRSLDEPQPRALDGTEEGTDPMFSHNGDGVIFLQQQRLKKFSFAGGGVTEFASSLAGRGFGILPDGSIAAVSDGSIKAYNTETRSERTLVPAVERTLLLHPYVLPGGEAILYTKVQRDALHLFGRTIGGDEIGPIVENASRPRYADGRLLFLTRDGAISGVPFSPRTLKISGTVMQIPGTGAENNASGFDAVRNVLVYVTGETRLGSRQLIAVDRSGASRAIDMLPAEFVSLTISPNARRVALGGFGMDADIWTYDLERSVASRLTFESEEDETPVWSPDGTLIAYSANRNRKRVVAVRNADGSGAEKVIWATEGHTHLHSWSPDGKIIAGTVAKSASMSDIWFISATGDGKAEPFIVSPFAKMEPAFSPDGKWLAYTSNETGRREVYVAALPSGAKLQISNMGGIHPVWARNGRELYYRDRNHIMAVSVQGGSELNAGAPKPMFDAPDYVSFAALPDGRFIALPVEQDKNPANLNVILNWQAELKLREEEGPK
jgi:eukaryotic-like serine/threonine-protein kinase